MSNIGIGPAYQTLAPSYVPLGKPAAGLESPENKDQTLPPVEESSASEKNRNQPHRKAEAIAEKDDGKEKERHRAGESSDAEREMSEPSAIDRAARADEAAHQTMDGSFAGVASIIAQAQLDAALQRAATLRAPDSAKVDGGSAVDSFQSNAGDALAPGALLDQRS